MMKFIYNAINKHNSNKTIMSEGNTEMYRQDFQERHEKALSQDINNLSDVINAFNDKQVTVWHCCTGDGYGYYTVSNGEKKRFVRSEYKLECVGGCWSLHVYERMYMGQLNLIKFLQAIKAEICSKFSAEMPLKTLYIAYILTDLNKWEDNLKKDDFYREEDKRDFEIAREYQREFKENYAEEIKRYNKVLANGGNFWSYYNNSDNYEYSCVANILESAISEIYKNREQLESCELWEKSRKVIGMLNEIKINNYYPQQNLFIEIERKSRKNSFIFGKSGSGKAMHLWDNLKRCPKCGYYPWIVGKDMKNYESGSPYTIICMNKAKCDCRSLQSYNVELCIEDWNKKT